MASTISAGTTAGTAIAIAGDTSGELQLRTNGTTTAMTINTAQQVSFVNNINAPNTFGFKNRIINGGMTISQRGTSFSVSTTGTYTTDRFAFAASGGGVITATQDSTAPAGFTNSLKATVATADSSIAAGDEYAIYQAIEGFNIADMGFGTASAQNITLSFWVRSSITGTYSGALYTSTRSYIFTYTISAANTFEYKTISLTADTSGTYNTTNGVGTIVGFDLGSGSNFNGTASTWQNGSFLHRVSGSVNWISTLGATFFITGVQLELGSAATTFDFRSIGTELALCQRYYEVLYADAAGENLFSYLWGTGQRARWFFQTQKRASPSFGLTSGGSWQVATPTGINGGINSVGFFHASSNYYLLGSANVAVAYASIEL